MSVIRKLISDVLVFFVGLLALVLLGDIRQGVVDVVGIAFVLSLFLIGALAGVSYRFPRKALHIAWMIFFAYLIGRFLTSDSPGYSATAFARYAMAYLVFGHFAYAARETTASAFIRGLLLFAFISIGLSFLTLIHRDLGAFLPGMNLLYPAYGHNHIVNIIVFILPFVVHELLGSRNVATVTAMLIISLAFVFSRARAGIGILALYCGWAVVSLRKNMSSAALLTAGLVFVVGVGGIVFLRPVSYLDKRFFVISPTAKSNLVESRLPYWRQAVSAIRARPFFGFGPGTFYLVSRKFQRIPGTHSWYAHSFILQTLAELGFVGALGVGSLLGYPMFVILRSMAKLKRKDPLLPHLWHGALLVFLYSFLEMNLDFLVIWLLFWATLGFLYRHATDAENTRPGRLSRFSQALCLVLGLSYVSAVASTAAGLFQKNYSLPFLLQPHVTGEALTYLSKKSATDRYEVGLTEKTIMFFHKNDPEIAFSMARYASPSGAAASLPWLYRAVEGDPLNQDYLSAYLDSLVRTLSPKDIGSMTLRLLAQAPRVTMDSKLFSMRGIDEEVGKALISAYREKSPRWREWYAGLAYVLAMEILPERPDVAKHLLLLARDMYPDLGFIHIDLARLYGRTFGNYEAAAEALKYCAKIPSAKTQCEKEGADLPPGDFLYLFI